MVTKVPAEWRANSESNTWFPYQEPKTREEINKINSFYGWMKVRIGRPYNVDSK